MLAPLPSAFADRSKLERCPVFRLFSPCSKIHFGLAAFLLALASTTAASMAQIAPEGVADIAGQTISLRSTELIIRDMEGLAGRHQIALPDLHMVPREQLGKLFLELMNKLS